MTTRGPSARARYMLGMVVDATGSGMYLPLSLLYFHHVTGLPLTQVGTLMTAAAMIGLISNPAAGVLIDRFGARAVVTGGYLLRAAGFCTYPLVDNGVSMFAVLLLVALGDMSYPPAIQSFIAEFVQGADRDKLLAVQRSLRNAGLGVGGLLAGAVLALGSDALYHVIVFGAAAGYVAAAACIGSIPVRKAASAGPRVSRKGGYRLVARNRPFLALTLLNVPTAFGYTVLSVGIPAYVTQDLGASHSLVGVLYAVNTVGIALLQIPVTRSLVAFRRSRAVALGAAVFAASFVVFAVLASVGDKTVVLVGVFAATLLFTAGELMHGATASALCAQAAPEETRGRHLAVYQLSWAVPMALAPAVLTALLTLSPTAMWLVLAAGATVSSLGVLRLERRLPEEAVYPRPRVAETEPEDGSAERARA